MGVSRGKVLVAMSGGVDSSVAAALLVRAGYDVVGCFMRLGSTGDELEGSGAAGACDRGSVRIGRGCCSVGDAADARHVAGVLGIPFYVCNFRDDFGRIIDYFVAEYAAGRTPNPCVRCNDWLKFGKLHDYAERLGCGFLSSGHYARIDRADGGAGAPRLLRGVDAAKDQSYVLFGVPRERLARMLLPVGGLTKPRVRELAAELGLPVHDKPDSQEICFVPDGDYAGLVEQRRPDLVGVGRILDSGGAVVGTHAGHHHFTLGQRRGVGVALGHPIYVVGKDPAANTITVGLKDDLLVSGCTVGEANWLTDPPALGAWTPCSAKYRYNTPAAAGRFRSIDSRAGPTPSGRSGCFEVRFDDPQSAVTAGQALVLYDAAEPDVVLGGGWIAS